MKQMRARPRGLVAASVVVAVAAAVTVLAFAPWASGATRFRHSAASPAFELGSEQGFAITVTNVGSSTLNCIVVVRGLDGSQLNRSQVSVAAGHSSVEGVPAGAFGSTVRVVVSSTSSASSNPCLPLVEILSFPSPGQNHVDAVITDFVVKNSAI